MQRSLGTNVQNFLEINCWTCKRVTPASGA